MAEFWREVRPRSDRFRDPQTLSNLVNLLLMCMIKIPSDHNLLSPSRLSFPKPTGPTGTQLDERQASLQSTVWQTDFKKKKEFKL